MFVGTYVEPVTVLVAAALAVLAGVLLRARATRREPVPVRVRARTAYRAER